MMGFGLGKVWLPEEPAPASAELERCALSSGVTRDAAVASLAQVIPPGSLGMMASGMRHDGAAWRRHGRGLVAWRAAMGRRAILRVFFFATTFDAYIYITIS
jgi:hypothetical protein